VKQDAYVAAWKAAWSEGCDARWRGLPVDAIPHKRGVARSAWLAGWQWASGQPDRRSSDARGFPQGRRRTDVAGS
jgi:hypothetical protein